ncbi:MAG: transglycosylase SLT domain-containing protein [Candidatus Latescibacteria bacterium]|nr:transglycosylase SLT domain-containing protein [Candidatus Latescibacterota bacterium]
MNVGTATAGPRPLTNANDDPAHREARLREAAKQFEGLFVQTLLKSMRSTVPMSDLIDNSGEIETYRQLLDEEMAQQIGGRGGLGIADLITDRYLSAALGEAPLDTRSPAPPLALPPAPARPRVLTTATARQALEAYGATAPLTRAAVADTADSADSLRTRAAVLGRAAADTVRVHGPAIEAAARETGLEPELVLAVIMQESGGNAGAVSPRGARGLMQLMPGTARDLGVRDPHDPATGIGGGARYLAQMRDRYDGDLTLALAAYNAGPGNVDRAGRSVPPFRETQNYVARITDMFRRLTGASGDGSAAREDS